MPTSPHLEARRRPSNAQVVGVLSLLLGLQPVTTDLYLPSLPGLARELGAPMAGAQLTLSALILAFGLGQLVVGPMSDRFGRRPLLLGGLSLYVVASLSSMMAPTIDALIVARAIQGLGLAAAIVCGRAMVRDLYEPLEGTHVMSRGQTGLGVFALASPLVGGWLAMGAGWRAALATTGLIAATGLVLVLLRLPETMAHKQPDALRPARMLGNWVAIAHHPAFRAWALLLLCTYGGLYTFLAGSAFVMIDVLGLSRSHYGWVLASSSASYLLGTFACRRALARWGIARSVTWAGFFSAAGGLSLIALTWWGSPTWWSIAAAQALFAFGHGVHQPCGQAGVVAPFPAQAGAASALSGFVLAGGAFIIGLWLGHTMKGDFWPLTLTEGVLALATALTAWTLVRRHGDPKP